MHRIAVFTRNHETHLKEAQTRSQPTAFQSKTRWVGAKKALEKQKTLKVYIAPIGEQQVTYEGTITKIAFKGQQEIEELLAARGEGTKNEDHWGETVYLVSNCCPISGASLSTLRKARDGIPLSDEYNYSYSLVRERDEP